MWAYVVLKLNIPIYIGIKQTLQKKQTNKNKTTKTGGISQVIDADPSHFLPHFTSLFSSHPDPNLSHLPRLITPKP